MPNPSPEVGPKPKWRSDGLPQFEVDRIVVFRRSQPESANMDGRGAALCGEGDFEDDDSSLTSEIFDGLPTGDA